MKKDLHEEKQKTRAFFRMLKKREKEAEKNPESLISLDEIK